jgi:hypothetical protein
VIIQAGTKKQVRDREVISCMFFIIPPMPIGEAGKLGKLYSKRPPRLSASAQKKINLSLLCFSFLEMMEMMKKKKCKQLFYLVKDALNFIKYL